MLGAADLRRRLDKGGADTMVISFSVHVQIDDAPSDDAGVSQISEHVRGLFAI